MLHSPTADSYPAEERSGPNVNLKRHFKILITTVN